VDKKATATSVFFLLLLRGIDKGECYQFYGKVFLLLRGSRFFPLFFSSLLMALPCGGFIAEVWSEEGERKIFHSLATPATPPPSPMGG